MKSLSQSVTNGLKDALTIRKKVKIAEYRVNYHKNQLRKMESLIASDNEHTFLRGQKLNQLRQERQMGIVTQTIGQQKYLAMQMDLEYKINLINETKLSLASSLNELVNVGSDLDPSNPMVKQLQARKEKLHQLEKKLDMQLQMYQTQLQLVQQNMSALK